MIRSIRRAHQIWAFLLLVGGLAILGFASWRRSTPLAPSSQVPTAPEAGDSQ